MKTSNLRVLLHTFIWICSCSCSFIEAWGLSRRRRTITTINKTNQKFALQDSSRPYKQNKISYSRSPQETQDQSTEKRHFKRATHIIKVTFRIAKKRRLNRLEKRKQLQNCNDSLNIVDATDDNKSNSADTTNIDQFQSNIDGDVLLSKNIPDDEDDKTQENETKIVQNPSFIIESKVSSRQMYSALQPPSSDELYQTSLSSDELYQTSSRITERKPIVIHNLKELRSAVLDQGHLLQDLDFNVSCFATRKDKKKERTRSKRKDRVINQEEIIKLMQQRFNSTSFSFATGYMAGGQRKQVYEYKSTMESKAQDTHVDLPFDHEVIKLIEKRFKTKSKPGSRAKDDYATLALSIEGGGMRGAVSAGMASAIAVLGLSDSFDSIYGSSAGSVIGAYMISRQMCIDVYTQVLTTAKSKFVSKARLASSLATNLLDQAANSTIFSKKMNPAMNISFVLDSIMDPEKGLRPLDMEVFKLNDQKQQLRIVTSTVRDGKMETHCLGSKNLDFFDEIDSDSGAVIERATTMANGKRHGLFACLETSMTVPTATGPPLPLLRNKDAKSSIISRCFDAFCYEPIPYRSAVQEGATHVLVLKTRPRGNPIGTKPGLFEKVFAPMYFDGNDMPQVSKFFENGGQQYIYAEDYLTLDEGKRAGKEGVLCPPQKILYGVDRDEEALHYIKNQNEWNRAHLLPVECPPGTPELSPLSVDTNEVLEAVQHGFAVAFDMLAPSTGIELNSHLNGKRVAELLFPVSRKPRVKSKILKNPVSITGDVIDANNSEEKYYDRVVQIDSWNWIENLDSENVEMQDDLLNDPCPKKDSLSLLRTLPGFSDGKMSSLSFSLYDQLDRSQDKLQ